MFARTGVIRGFKNKITEAVFDGLCPRGFPVQIFPIARRKLNRWRPLISSATCGFRPAIVWMR